MHERAPLCRQRPTTSDTPARLDRLSSRCRQGGSYVWHPAQGATDVTARACDHTSSTSQSSACRKDFGRRDVQFARSSFNVDAPTLNSAPSLKDVVCSKINVAPSHASFLSRNSSFRHQHSSFTRQQRTLGGKHSKQHPATLNVHRPTWT